MCVICVFNQKIRRDKSFCEQKQNDYISKITSLKVCYLVENLPAYPIDFKNVKWLNISFSRISKIPESFKNIETLIANNSLLKFIPPLFEKLIHINISECKIKDISFTFTNLKELFCDKTDIVNIPTTLINLEYLDVSNTKIYNLPVSYSNTLKYLYCYNTEITVIPSEYDLIDVYCTNTYILLVPGYNVQNIICDARTRFYITKNLKRVKKIRVDEKTNIHIIQSLDFT